jgi:hypothetical protein
MTFEAIKAPLRDLRSRACAVFVASRVVERGGTRAFPRGAHRAPIVAVDERGPRANAGLERDVHESRVVGHAPELYRIARRARNIASG